MGLFDNLFNKKYKEQRKEPNYSDQEEKPPVNYKKPLTENDTEEIKKVLDTIINATKEELHQLGQISQNNYILCYNEGGDLNEDYTIMQSPLAPPELETLVNVSAKNIILARNLRPIVVIKTMDARTCVVNLKEHPEVASMSLEEQKQYVKVKGLSNDSLMFYIEKPDETRIIKYDYITFDDVQGVVIQEEPSMDYVVTTESKEYVNTPFVKFFHS